MKLFTSGSAFQKLSAALDFAILCLLTNRKIPSQAKDQQAHLVIFWHLGHNMRELLYKGFSVYIGAVHAWVLGTASSARIAGVIGLPPKTNLT